MQVGGSYSAAASIVTKTIDYYKFIGKVAVRLVEEAMVEPKAKISSEEGYKVDKYV
ncbi:MAG: hypothetical protein L3V56_12490 [Candidatus Magnetoovum sp. WYHC-5]|nr:hypothetical protein [Candidatus Magnetoovum sp. WYHC-5]